MRQLLGGQQIALGRLPARITDHSCGSPGKRDRVVLATKVHGSMGDDPNQRGNSRRWITEEVENSLRRLGTDWIDLYQIHRPEPDTDIDEGYFRRHITVIDERLALGGVRLAAVLNRVLR